jgi:tetratricopeptide (TPR) repeat protein
MRRFGLALLALALAACTTPLQRGERLYRDGDRLGALEVWGAVGEDDDQYAEVAARIEHVEDEFERFLVQYKNDASYFEGEGQLAESILNYRLALKLRPDPEVLSRVQDLARELALTKAGFEATYRDAMARNDLASARSDLKRLRHLDRYDPKLENDQRQLDASLRAEISRLLAAGRAAFAKKDYEAAEKAFDAVLVLDPQNRSAPAELRAERFYKLGQGQEELGKFYWAIRYYLGALNAYPEHVLARQRLASVRAKQASEVEGLINNGREEFRKENLRKAMDEWDRALLIDPDNERAQAYVARAERQLQNLQQLRSEPDVSERGLE